jgi:tetratricopeptide (TPR) repeat protein
LAAAREYLEGVLRLVKDPSTSEWMRWRYSMHLFASLGELALARGDLDGARGHADACLEGATRTRSRKYLVKGWRLRGELALAERRWDEAEQALREALSVAKSSDDPSQLWKTHLVLGRLGVERQRPHLAQQEWQAARQVIKRVRDNLRHPRLRASFEASPIIRQILDVEATG